MPGKEYVFEGDQRGVIAGRDVITAGRDVIVGGRFEAFAAEFFEPALDNLGPSTHPVTGVSGRLVDQLTQARLLVIGGHHLLEKDAFALHLAWLVRERTGAAGLVKADSGPAAKGGCGLAVKQSCRAVDRGTLRAALQRETEKTLFLIMDAQPHQFGFDVYRLHRDVQATGHFVLITTDSVAQQWGLEAPAEETAVWFDRPTEEVYSDDVVARFLRQRLEAIGQRAPEILEAVGITLDGKPRIAEQELSQVAARLRTPSSIRALADSLAQGLLGDGKSLRQRIEQLSGDRAAIGHWYRGLPPREQLLVLGLVLFDRLFDDQAFAALETLVDVVWRDRDGALRQFDYFELERARAYFGDAGLDSGVQKIESRSWEIRQAILEVAWNLHRRSILVSLPVMVELVRRSLAEGERSSEGRDDAQRALGEAERHAGAKGAAPEGDRTAKGAGGERPGEEKAASPAAEVSSWELTGQRRELWGSGVRGRMLRESISDSLSLIGLLSADSLDPFLRDLACDRDLDVQLVAANALAFWRRPSYRGAFDAQLFRRLREWNDRTYLRELFDWRSAVAGDPVGQKMAHIRATVALIIGYAARYDPPDHLAPELYRLFERLIDDPNRIVRDRFSEVTVPLMMGSHLKQLEPLLRERAIAHGHLVIGIARGFARVLELRPEEALEVIDDWTARCRGERLGAAGEEAPQARVNMLAAILLAYGFFNSTPFQDVLSLSVIFDKFRRALAEETIGYLRRLAIWGALAHLHRRFHEAEPLIQDLMTEITLEERVYVVQGLTEIYLRQRADLEGGDAYLVLGGIEYAIWTASRRPLTAVETALRRWLDDDGRPVPQQVALQAFVAFWNTELEQRERKLIGSIPSGHPASGLSQDQPRIRALDRLRDLGAVGKLIPALLVPPATKLKRRVMALLPELVAQQRASRGAAALLQKWREDADRPLKLLAKYLGKSAFLYRHHHSIAILLAALLFVYVYYTFWR